MARDEVYVNVKSTNIWDEVWTFGNISTSDGQTSSGGRVIPQNNIEVDAEETYYCPNGNIQVFYYASDDSYLGYSSFLSNQSNRFTTPSGCAYIKFRSASTDSTPYANDISISLGSSPIPYMPHDTKGKVWKKQQVGRVDLSTLSYSYNSTYKCHITTGLAGTIKPPSASTEMPQILCENYKVTIQNVGTHQNGDVFVITNGNVWFYDDTNSISPDGEMLYALASPIWTDITSSAMGAALLALETIEESSNTITINNSGVIDMVQYFTPI